MTDQSIQDEIALKRMELQYKQSAKADRDELRSVDKELKQAEFEENHPDLVRVGRRAKRTGAGIKQQTGNAWKNARATGRTVAKHTFTQKGPYARPKGYRMAGPPAPAKRIRDIQSKGDVVTQTMDRNFFSSGPPELLNPNSVSDPRNLENLTGRSNPGSVSNLSFDNLIGSNQTKKERRLY